MCGAQDVRYYATEEQPSVGSNQHMGSSICESFPMSEQVHLGGHGLFVQLDEALPVLRPTRRIQRRWFMKSHFLALNFQESCLVVKAHTSQDKTNRKCLSELRVKPPCCYSIRPLDQWPGRNISQEDQKHSAEESECHGKGWNSMIPEVLWAYQTAFKTPIGQTPHQLIYGKTCHTPVDLEFRSHGVIKRWKMDLQSAGVKREIQWAELDEWRKKAYHSSKLYRRADEKMTR